MPRSLLLEQTCLICRSTQSTNFQVCEQCLAKVTLRPHSVDRPGLPTAYFAADYQPALAELLHYFKLGKAHSVARWMAESLHPALPKLAGKTLLIPVPSGSKATAERGFVPAQVLAKQLARLMSETRVVEGIWQRREVQDQAALNVVLRQTNIEGSMLASPGFARLKNTNLVLIDDVITTGASMTECQRALRAVGCEPSFLFAYAETLRKTAT